MHYAERITWKQTLGTSRGCGAYAEGKIMKKESEGKFSFTEKKKKKRLLTAFGAFTRQQPNQRHPMLSPGTIAQSREVAHSCPGRKLLRHSTVFAPSFQLSEGRVWDCIGWEMPAGVKFCLAFFATCPKSPKLTVPR